MAVDGLPSVTWLHPHRCDEIALYLGILLCRTATTTKHQKERNPLALLPVARSPSRMYCYTRW
jgi:hypothetical protein